MGIGGLLSVLVFEVFDAPFVRACNVLQPLDRVQDYFEVVRDQFEVVVVRRLHQLDGLGKGLVALLQRFQIYRNFFESFIYAYGETSFSIPIRAANPGGDGDPAPSTD
jgi:hypothetical protein